MNIDESDKYTASKHIKTTEKTAEYICKNIKSSSMEDTHTYKDEHVLSPTINTVSTTVLFKGKKKTMTANEKRLDKRARQSEQQNKVENENRQMENNTEKYQECHEETTQIHEGDKQRKECARLQETKMETAQKHKNQDIKTFISEIISQAISMSVTKSCEQNKVKAIECPMKNAKQRCKKCWISHTP